MPHEFAAVPWHVTRSGAALLVVDAEGCIVAQVGSPTAAEKFSTVPRANAQLIACAPRLLKHLEKAYRALADIARSDPGLRVTLEEMDAMTRAIGDAGGSTE